MCGQPRYCLPPNANIEVWVKVADLFSCDGNESCLQEAGMFGNFDTCTNGICHDKNQRNNPQANAGMNGVMDVAFNSLDGDMNANAEGPQSQNEQPPFNYNDLLAEDGKTIDRSQLTAAQTGKGDDFSWSFWVSDKIDNISPVIVSATQSSLDLVQKGEQVPGANITTPLSILFDKLMLSSSLKPGRNYPDDFYVTIDPKQQIHREYLVFAKFTGRPLGYWVSKENQSSQNDGTDDRTAAKISHTDFDASAAYGFVAGSGLQDVYQNCYNPAADKYGSDISQCAGQMSAGYLCCKGVIVENKVDVKTGKKVMCYDFE